MAVFEKSRLFASPKMDSKIKSANVQNSERWIGYFASPMLIYMSYYMMSGAYLNLFYVDVLRIGGIAGGMFLALLPLLSKIFDAVTNLIMGQIIDKTRTRQGKIRPWILVSGPLLTFSGIMLYCVPKASTMVQAIWVAISYNIYFALAFTIYNMSQILLIPLSTRNTKQRDGLALLINMGQSMLPGSVVYMFAPLFLLPWMGVDASRWALVMSIISIVLLPGVLLQYFFTKERISEDGASEKIQTVSLGQQMKACFSNKFWVYYLLLFLSYQFQQSMYSISTTFFCNWVAGTYNDGVTLTLVNVIGQMPLGIGVFLLWPLAKKFGKRKTMLVGMVMAVVGSMIVWMFPHNMPVVLAALAFKSFGMLPTYLIVAYMAEAMDHVEWRSGFRCDGLTATFTNVAVTVMAGLTTSIFNAGLNSKGYVPPAADGSWVAQNADVQGFLTNCVALVPAVCFAIMLVCAYLFKVEDMMPQISADIAKRRKAEAEARGEVYISPEEKAAIEQEKENQIAEEKRIEELKERCARKGLNFEEEEAKYQAKLAAKAAKKSKKSKNK